MSRFLIGWSLISPLCFSLIFLPIILWPGITVTGSVILKNSVIMYFVYWVILGCLQGGWLFWRFQRQKLAYRWGVVTGIIGFSVMGMHDLVILLLGVDLGGFGGQGVLFLILSLTVLALAGGWILGLAQYFVLQEHLEAKPKQEDNRLLGWLGLSFVSWGIGFLGCWLISIFIHRVISSLGSDLNPIWYLLVLLPMALGTFLKGWFIRKYLAVPSQS
jgi:hypothetical protein